MDKHIAIFIPTMVGGGAEMSMLRLANSLAGRKYHLDLVLSKAKGSNLPKVSKQVNIVDFNAPRVLLCLPALVRYLRREKPDVLFSNLDYANIIAVWARRIAGTKTRLVIYEHNTMSMTSHHARQWRQRLVPQFVKRFYPWADDIICVSGGVAKDLSEVSGIPMQRIKVIYNPVVTPELTEKAKDRPHHPWFEAGQPPVLLAVGRLTHQKDFPTLIQAFALVRETCPARLMILGEGPDRPQLEVLIKDLHLEEDVSLPGFVDNPYAFMSNASLFILSSRWEGLPTVLIEALSCGVPVIATDCPSGPREILAEGRYGALVPVQDAPALARRIRMALEGNIPQPCPESWKPYELENITNQYTRILVGE